VELFEQIRRDRREESMSIRELAVRHGVHRRTVRQALASAVPPQRKVYPPRSRPAIDPWREVIDAWLIADREVPRKQRHTARRIWQRLVAEHGARLAEVTVSRYVSVRRVELGITDREVFISQVHPPGAEAAVDFGEFEILLAGAVVKVWMFVMRLSCSGKAFHVAYPTQAQEAFLAGHVAAFEYFGGVPGRIRYDNLKPAVTRVLMGRDRTESDRFIALRSHYGFDSFFCNPGKQGAREKGGVEGEIDRFRRRHLVPVPNIATLAELAELVAAGDAADDDRVITGRTSTVGAAFADEKSTLMALPAEAFDPRVVESRRVDSGPGYRSGSATTRCPPAMPAGGSRSGWVPAWWRFSTAPRWSPRTRPVIPRRRLRSTQPPASCTYPPCVPKQNGWPRSPCVNTRPTAATWPKSSPPRSTTVPNAAACAGSTKPSSRASSGSPSSTSTPSPPSNPRPGAPGRRELPRRRRTRGHARRLRHWEDPPAHRTRAGRLRTRPQGPLRHHRPPGQRTRRSRRRTRPVRVAARYGRLDLLCLGELGYVQIDPAAPSCSSRSSPNAKNAPASRSRPTCPSASGAPCSPTPARRRDRRSGHLQRPHPRDRHPVLPVTHQQEHPPQGQLTRSRRGRWGKFTTADGARDLDETDRDHGRAR
jgi:transposase